MNKILAGIFKNKVVNAKKLVSYGFDADGVYKTKILDGEFGLLIRISDSDIETRVTEPETNEPYTLFLAEGATGSFVGEVRAEYERVLSEIAEKCFDTCVFKNEQSRAVIDYIKLTYGGEPEFLWKKFDDNAIWRRKDSKKWYGALLTVTADKIGLPSDERLEIIDLRIDPDDMEKTIDNKTFFRGYHMNKRHWITVVLDGSADLQTVFEMIDTSYILAEK